MKKKKGLKIAIIIALIAGLCGGEYYYINQTNIGKMSVIQDNLQEKDNELNALNREVAVATRDIKTGEQLIDTANDPTNGNFAMQEIKSDADLSLYFTNSGDIGTSSAATADNDATANTEDSSEDEESVDSSTESGELSTESMTEEDALSEDSTMYEEQTADTSENEVSGTGSKALVDITAGTPILLSMVSDEQIQKDTRLVDVNVVTLQANQEDNDIVDIRALFPDGTDYIVFSKQQIRNLNGTSFQLYLTEDQIQTLDSATVDAAEMGATLYTTKYVQSQLQDAAIPFYPVRQSTIDLIASDPNVLVYAKETMNKKARQALEERMPQIDSTGNAVVTNVQADDTPVSSDEASTDEAQVDTAESDTANVTSEN